MGRTETKAQETLNFEVSKPIVSFPTIRTNVPLSIPDEKQMLCLTSWKVKKLFFNRNGRKNSKVFLVKETNFEWKQSSYSTKVQKIDVEDKNPQIVKN